MRHHWEMNHVSTCRVYFLVLTAESDKTSRLSYISRRVKDHKTEKGDADLFHSYEGMSLSLSHCIYSSFVKNWQSIHEWDASLSCWSGIWVKRVRGGRMKNGMSDESVDSIFLSLFLHPNCFPLLLFVVDWITKVDFRHPFLRSYVISFRKRISNNIWMIVIIYSAWTTSR
jgi:hypothetical protein